MRDLLGNLKISRRAITFALFLFFGWLVVIVASGTGWNPFHQTWNFQNPGVFGDSFGPLSAFMALLAAIGAIATFNSQNEEIARLRKREVEVDKLAASERSQLFARQQLADERAEAQQFETTFFGLLKAFRDLVISLDLIDESNKDYKAEGHDVFRDMLALFKGNHFIADSNAVGVVSLQWPLFANHFKNDLNHYFRTLYHIVCFVERARVENKYFYIQILRSFLSEAELSLLALNCECGEGRQKFKVLVEKFALLHNLSEDEIKFLEAKAKIFYLRVSAFGRNG